MLYTNLERQKRNCLHSSAICLSITTVDPNRNQAQTTTQNRNQPQTTKFATAETRRISQQLTQKPEEMHTKPGEKKLSARGCKKLGWHTISRATLGSSFFTAWPAQDGALGLTSERVSGPGTAPKLSIYNLDLQTPQKMRNHEEPDESEESNSTNVFLSFWGT